MKRLISLMFAAALAAPLFAQSAKVVVSNNGEAIGLYVKTNANTYTVGGQDDWEVPKAGNKIVTFSAENGQGVVSCKNFGRVNVRNTPSTSGTKIGTLTFEEGDIPEAAPCLGKENGWYKIQLGDKVGYVRQDLVVWNAIDLF